jgi:hypothetical protein
VPRRAKSVADPPGTSLLPLRITAPQAARHVPFSPKGGLRDGDRRFSVTASLDAQRSCDRTRWREELLNLRGRGKLRLHTETSREFWMERCQPSQGQTMPGERQGLFGKHEGQPSLFLRKGGGAFQSAVRARFHGVSGQWIRAAPTPGSIGARRIGVTTAVPLEKPSGSGQAIHGFTQSVLRCVGDKDK